MRRIPCRFLLLVIVGTCSATLRASAAPADTIHQRVRPCLACHGEQHIQLDVGYIPRLSGAPAGYLYNQLHNYRAQRRQSRIMSRMVSHLSNAYLWEMAQYFAGRRMEFASYRPDDVDTSLLPRGREIATQGDDDRGVPPCEACHGKRFTGVRPNTPGIVGMPRNYLMGQLGAWREGTRHAVAPDCMHEIARRLSPREIEAVASWLASLPVPDDPHPAEHPPGRRPLDCGSVKLPGGLR